MAALLLLALAAGGFAYFRRATEEVKAIRFLASPPEGWNLRQGVGNASPAPLAVSPDGQHVAFVATGADGKNFLWIRSLDALTAQSLAGTDDAASPFWSPDSRYLGFFAGGKLKKIDISSGPPITLCDAPTGQGGAWSQNGVIVFEAITTANSALQKVAAAGGTPTAAVVLAEGEIRSQRPFFLPDGRHFLYETEKVAGPGQPIYVASLDSTERKLLLNSDSSNVVYSQGHLLFLRETTLMAQPFDARRLELTGEAFPIAEQIQTHSVGELYANFSASENGVLVYQTGAEAGGSQLTWFDRSGKQIGVLGNPAPYSSLALSPDGMRAAVSIWDQVVRTRDIWVYDVARGLRTRFTSDPASEQDMSWSPDGTRLIFNSSRKGPFDLYQKAVDGSGTEELVYEDAAANMYPASWSADGRFILFSTGSGSRRTGADLFVLSLSGDRKPAPFMQTQFNESDGWLSPDGRWIAYSSNESGAIRTLCCSVSGSRRDSTGFERWWQESPLAARRHRDFLSRSRQ